MSAGDIIRLEGKRYRVDAIGFTEIPMPAPTGVAAQFLGALFVSHYLVVAEGVGRTTESPFGRDLTTEQKLAACDISTRNGFIADEAAGTRPASANCKPVC